MKRMFTALIVLILGGLVLFLFFLLSRSFALLLEKLGLPGEALSVGGVALFLLVAFFYALRKLRS